MLKCESCLSRFQQATDLFQHIQSSCLSFYKKHPEHWAEILSKMTVPASNSENNQLTSGDNYSHSEEMSQSSQTSSKSPAQAKQKKEPPFCIMFKAQKVKKGQPAKSMHMTVADYFYGQLDGKSLPMKKIKRVCKCTDCGKALRNNIRLMSHARHKIVNGWEKKEVNGTKNICYHCYKEYNSPFLLQCHLENVHGAVPASSTCKICEVHFPTDREFLIHMKDHHVQNEAPYSCKVCTYRSSVHSDVMKHFRDQHIDTTALMCPFCFAVCYAGNAYLKHVLQHKKNGYACSKCRLIFNSTAERAAHLRSDHKSNYIKEKVTKFKNYHLCQIYVRVAPYKDEKPDDILKTGSKRPFVHEGPVRHTKMLRSPDSDELPTYLYPVKRSNCVRKVSVALPKGSTGKLRCTECHEKLEATSVDLRDHFRYQHECRWCVYVTSCEKASHDHVLRDHADDEMREQIFGKTDNEETKFPIILQDDDDDDPILSNIKEEPPEDILPIPTDSFEETKPDLPPIPDAPEISPPTKGRRKQPNPMKIADIFQPRSVVKPKTDRCVQTNGLEKEKGVQACDEDFKNLHGNANVVDSDNANPQGKRRRKVLAQPGYFPDIDDDDGWAKYFASVDKEPAANKSAKSSMLSLNAMHWPSMVPRQGTFSILNRALQSQQTGSRADSCKPDSSKPRYQFHMYGEKTGATGSNGPQLSITGQAGGQLTNKLQTILRSAPLPPRNLRCNGCTHETMLVQWDPPANNAVTQYKITFQGVGPHTTQLLPLNQTLVKLVGLKPDVMYAVRVHTLFYTAVSEFANIFVKTEPTPRNARARKPSSTVATSTKTTTSVARRPQSAGLQTTSSKTVPLSSNHSRPLSQISTARIPATAVYPNEPALATKLLTVSSQGTSSRVVTTQKVSRGVAAVSSAAVSSQHKTSNASFSSVKQFLKVPVGSRGGELSKNNNDVVFLKLDDNKKTQKSDVLVRTVAKSNKTEGCNDVILVLDDDNETFKVTKCDKPVATKQKSNGPVDSDREVICVDTTDAANLESSTEKSVEGGKSEVCQQTKRMIEVNSEPTQVLPAVTDESFLTDSCSSQSNDKMTKNKAVTGVGDSKQDNNNCASQPIENNDIVLEDSDTSKNGTQESVATSSEKVALPSTDSAVPCESQTDLISNSSKNEKNYTVKFGSDAEDEKSENVSMRPTDPVCLPKNSSENENGAAVAADCKVCSEETDTQRQDEAAVPPKSTGDSGPLSDSCSKVPDICISKEDSAETSSMTLATDSSSVLESVEDLANPGRKDESGTSKAMFDASQELDSAMKDICGDLHADSSKPTEPASSADSDNIVTNGSEALVSGALLKQLDDESKALDGTIPMDCSSGDVGNMTVNGVTNDEPNFTTSSCHLQGNAEALQQTIRQDDLEEKVSDMSDDLMIPEEDIMNAVNDEDISMDDIGELLRDAVSSWN